MSLSSNSFDLIPRIQNNYFFKDLTNINSFYILILGIIILFFVSIFIFTGKNENNTSSPLLILIEIIMWFILVLVIIINVNTKDYDFTTSISNLFNDKLLNLDVIINGKTNDNNNGKNDNSGNNGNNNNCDGNDKAEEKKEVFHIPNNKHTYEESRKICRKYNSRLATYNEIENAYNNGANWCSYGWSEDQLALFPTQKDIYDKLKLIPGHENDCGRQGVNGGYIDNPYVRFGVNCYGEKPKRTKKDKEYMNRLKFSYSPAITEDELTNIKEDNKNYIISPFNRDKWRWRQ